MNLKGDSLVVSLYLLVEKGWLIRYSNIVIVPFKRNVSHSYILNQPSPRLAFLECDAVKFHLTSNYLDN